LKYQAVAAGLGVLDEVAQTASRPAHHQAADCRCHAAVGNDDTVRACRDFGETAERRSGHVIKGDKLYVEGDLCLNDSTDREGKQRTGSTVAAWRVERLGEICSLPHGRAVRRNASTIPVSISTLYAARTF
jgi:Single-strand binding protein family